MPSISPEAPDADSSAGTAENTGQTNQLEWTELEMLADKIINLMKRELILDNEREGRKP